MPFDGITVSAICSELKSALINSRIDKIYQPEADEIILNIRAFKNKYKLLISATSKYPRLHFTNIQKENPKSPPMFCMLMRKHLQGSKILHISQKDMERIVYIDFESYDELGDMKIKRLIIEIMGRHSNIILIDKESNIIIDSIKRIPSDINRHREVLPAKEYILPPSQDKTNLLNNLVIRINRKDEELDLPLFKYIYTHFQGISPSSAKGICHMANLDYNKNVTDLNNEEIDLLTNTLIKLKNIISNENFIPHIIRSFHEKEIIDFNVISEFMDEKSYRIDKLHSISSMLEYFYSQKDILDRLKQKSSSMRKVVNTNLSKLIKKEKKLNKEFNTAVDSEKYKIYGELLTANLYQIKEGEKQVHLLNYYSPDGEYMTIDLDKKLSPSQNAQKYYKKYNKSKTAKREILNQLEETQHEIKYFEQVSHSLEIIRSMNELEELRLELMEEGYLKRRNIPKKKKEHKMEFLSFLSSDGFTIYVGKNNKQNDYLTLKFSSKKDLWFHTKDIPGSHVIISTKGREVPESTIKEAAELAAFHSKGKLSSKVPVDYTLIKNVKKPSGAKLGMVIYDDYNTLYITPREDLYEILEKNK
ncbi:MAG: NFACT family protein [Anaeromicrobium sp.]|jgi:predicted ribosome quality control (RQC) complex YloA/Tae2 family protein|uniref:Rqc2 family fibronectin-binding protein n=1 Tax=Anaeromicrobium sp. TaxID=1929132 RepID=UPI0025CCFF2B|nr:NFACT RNA binding domain-containing protein [Anaeromicrobium sp.]MCT4594909.1 NFACT family protein [Anaeromicrobium sp.]